MSPTPKAPPADEEAQDADETNGSSSGSDSGEEASSSGSEGSEGSCAPGGELVFRFTDLGNVGLTMNSFVSGFAIGGLNALLFGVIFGYFNLPTFQATAGFSLINMPTTFSFLFGILSDAKPIFGMHRKPYIAIGWALAFAALLAATLMPFPAPYYCVDATGGYLMELPPCNPGIREDFNRFVAVFFVLVLGLAVGGAASNGLLVEYAKQEPEETRGATQVSLGICTTVGQFASTLLCAFGFNGKSYMGSWDQADQLSFQQMTGIFSVAAGVALCTTCLALREPPPRSAERGSVRKYLRTTGRLLTGKALFFVAIYLFAVGAIGSITTPAGPQVQNVWAGVKMLQKQLISLVSLAISLGCQWLVMTCFLNTSWRKIMLWTTISTILLDAPVQLLTIFDIFRDQYFYLGEPITKDLPAAFVGVVALQLSNELSSGPDAGLVSGIIGTVGSVASPVAAMASDELFGLFHPSLSEPRNYLTDAVSFRRMVWYSYLVSYAFSISTLVFLPLLPEQKQDANDRKRHWGHSRWFAGCVIGLLAWSFVYSVTISTMTMIPSWACSKLVGGPGCAK